MRSYGWRPQATRAAAPAAPRAAIRDSAIRIAPAAARTAFSRAALLGSVWLGALATLTPDAAHAIDIDGTWTGSTNAEWIVGTNWNSTPNPDTVPNHTAAFTSNNPTSVTISGNASIDTIDFSAATKTYSFTVQNGATFTITGGMINTPSLEPSFTVSALSTLAVGDGAFAEIGSLAGGGRVTIGPSSPFSLLRIVGNGTGTFSGTFSGAGSIELDDTVSLTLTGASNGGNIGAIGGDLMLCGICSGPTLTISGGSLTVGGQTIVEGGTLTVTNGGTLTTTNFGVAGSAVITGAGSSVTVTGQTFVGNFAPASLTISSGGVLNSQGGAEIDIFPFLPGIPTATVTGPGSTWNVGGFFGLTVGGGGTGGPGALIIANGGVVNSTTSTTIGDLTGSSSVIVTGAGSVLNAFGSLAIGGCGCGALVGTLTIADGGVVNSPGATSIGAGSTLNLGTGGLAGAIVTPAIVNDGQIAANFTDTLTLAANLSGAGTLSKAGPGTLILTGASTYTGATTIDGGTLIVNGSIANSTVTVNAGGRLGGTGTLGNTIINGGTLSPGNSIGTLTVNGNLTMTAAASYLVEISPTNADRTNVAGTATLAGIVQAVFAAGSFMTRNYTILSATGGRGGTFSALTTANLPAGFSASLSYTATDATLNLTAALGALTILGVPNAPGGSGAPACAFSVNQCNVANALNTFFNNGGALPPAFVNIFGLTGVNLGNALTLLSGEAATGAQQAAFQLTNQFLGIMLDPFVDGRSGAAGTGGPALGFAPGREELPDDIALAYSKILKAPPKPASFEQRWSVWGAGYGGGNRTSGDPAVVGSHDLSARTAGGTAGLDYHLTRDSLVGVALAGGGTNWSLAQGIGGGKSDAFQAGIYGATRWGPAYLAAALSFTNHWMSTDRFAFAGDHLTSSFNAQSFGGRVEGGYRFMTVYGGLTPYAAIQAQSFHTPSYSESDLNAGGFALAYNSRNATDTRSELGGRFDRVLLLNPDAALTLRARVAWAHDWISDPSLAALFQTLPGTSFIVNGATPAKNSALTSAGAELRLANGVALLAKFDGEFASHSSTYAGTGTVRYTW
jgi:autotransporter-associated beta strand protein/T5SS/PEP-CTERM-associated repeat protein